MQVPLLNRSSIEAHKTAGGTLELRIRQIHRRRRRALMRRAFTVAIWSAGIVCAAAFVYALTIGVAQP
jgi:hypothetical protein